MCLSIPIDTVRVGILTWQVKNSMLCFGLTITAAAQSRNFTGVSQLFALVI
ncbi:hypothetical protein NSP_48100 [Nodularia spumigena CCY9414]|nr:hypothetical protein NSP_48100 [Nodularia spumigena CCY9414]